MPRNAFSVRPIRNRKLDFSFKETTRRDCCQGDASLLLGERGRRIERDAAESTGQRRGRVRSAAFLTHAWIDSHIRSSRANSDFSQRQAANRSNPFVVTLRTGAGCFLFDLRKQPFFFARALLLAAPMTVPTRRRLFQAERMPHSIASGDTASQPSTASLFSAGLDPRADRPGCQNRGFRFRNMRLRARYQWSVRTRCRRFRARFNLLGCWLLGFSALVAWKMVLVSCRSQAIVFGS